MKSLGEIDKILLKVFQRLYNKSNKHPELPNKIILPLNYRKKKREGRKSR